MSSSGSNITVIPKFCASLLLSLRDENHVHDLSFSWLKSFPIIISILVIFQERSDELNDWIDDRRKIRHIVILNAKCHYCPNGIHSRFDVYKIVSIKEGLKKEAVLTNGQQKVDSICSLFFSLTLVVFIHWGRACKSLALTNIKLQAKSMRTQLKRNNSVIWLSFFV